MTTDPLQGLLAEVQKVEKRRIKPALTWEALAAVIKDTANGGTPPVEDDPVQPLSIPTIPDEFPKLLVSYGKTTEWTIVENWNEWAPLHHWWVRPMSELAALKEQGAQERPKEDWQRRKQGKA